MPPRRGWGASFFVDSRGRGERLYWAMLSLEAIALQTGEREQSRALLEGLNVRMRRGELVAVVGPSGCGKSTLLKVIAGLTEPTAGAVCWDGRDLATDGDLAPTELGYVPQFSLAYDRLTVRESVDYALRLRVAGLDGDRREERIGELLATTGLDGLADRRVGVLSGGQRRRLALAIEMSSSPSLLLCDEVTSGLDPGSAREIVSLLHALSRADGGQRRVVVNVTHSMIGMELYDRVIVLCEGKLAYQGPPEHLAHYFRAEHTDAVYGRLAQRTGGEWDTSWRKHGHFFDGGESDEERVKPTTSEREAEDVPDGEEQAVTPDFLTQFGVLFGRRIRLFVRERGQLALQAALILGFPCLVVVFALKGLPRIHNLSLENDLSVVEQLRESASYLAQAFDVGGLVSGLLLFQIILLALMGSNNGALEIAGERLLFEREKLAGLSPVSYLVSKAVFLGLLITVQAVWMVLFVHAVCGFPGDLLGQAALLWLAGAALTAVCLAFSSFASTPSQASLISVYFVGFQLPLSGAVLALPDALAKLTRPFIAAYWSWAGSILTLRDTRFYDLILHITKTELAALPVCCWVLLAHVALGTFLAYLGCRRSVWD